MSDVISADPISRKKVLWHTDSDGSVVVEHRQDIEPILEDAQARRNAASGNWRGDMHHVARIPNSVFYALPKEIQNDPKALKAWLNEADQSVFRTKPGRL